MFIPDTFRRGWSGTQTSLRLKVLEGTDSNGRTVAFVDDAAKVKRETITHTANGKTDTYEIVEAVPRGYMIWNIGSNAPEGYLPLCRPAQFQRFPGGRDIDPNTL